MSCYVVPLVEAAIVSACRKRALRSSSPLLQELPALEKMLWGGTLMLIVDHIINGELTWRFPFFTALDQAGGGLVMLREMLTVGVPMSLVLTAAWLVWAFVRDRKRAAL